MGQSKFIFENYEIFIYGFLIIIYLIISCVSSTILAIKSDGNEKQFAITVASISSVFAAISILLYSSFIYDWWRY
jgi:hypothetical protein